MRKTYTYLIVAAVVVMAFTALSTSISAAYVGDVTILSGGGFAPADAPIIMDGNEYTLTDDIHGSITIQESGITLNGAGYTVDGLGTGYRAVFIAGLNHVTVTNLNVQGWFIGIQLITSTECTITGNTVSDITRAGTALISNSNNNIVSDNSYTNCGWGVVAVLGSTGNTICGNTADGCTTSGISIERTSGNLLEGNTISNSYYGMATGYSTGVTMTNNVMEGDSIVMWGNLLEHWNTHTIDTSNTVNGKPVVYWKDIAGGKIPEGAGQVILTNCQNVQVKEQETNHGSVGIILGYCTNCQVKENTASYNRVYGIYTQDSNGNEIKENMLSDNGFCGLVMEDSNDNTIKENQALNSGSDGIWLITSNGNNIKENIASNNQWGIFLTSCSQNIINENTVMDNSLTGIHLYQTSYENVVYKNTIKKNYQGVVLDTGTSVNVVHHNNFFHNDIQARDDGTGNLWDDGSEGNYWSDYKGKDLDNDGVGDTDLPHQGVDWFPLMKPC